MMAGYYLSSTCTFPLCFQIVQREVSAGTLPVCVSYVASEALHLGEEVERVALTVLIPEHVGFTLLMELG